MRSGYVGIKAVLTACRFRYLVRKQEGSAGVAMLQALL